MNTKTIKKLSILCIIAIAIIILFYIPTPVVGKEYNTEIATIEGRYLHFSLDDVQRTCENLSKHDKGTIFAEPTLKILKQWHDKYGIVVSLYVQGDFTINSKYAKELIDNSDWLKWGYHGNTDNARKTDMQSFYKQITDSIGSSAVIDNSPRIHYFHADHTTCIALKDLGCNGFLTCDDWSWNSKKRGSNYYLTPSQNRTLDKNDRLYDTENKVYFIKTDFRLEHIAQRWGDINNCLEYYSTNNTEDKELIIFSHEWCYNSFLDEADYIFSWANPNGYEFDFPENRIPTNNKDIQNENYYYCTHL